MGDGGSSLCSCTPAVPAPPQVRRVVERLQIALKNIKIISQTLFQLVVLDRQQTFSSFPRPSFLGRFAACVFVVDIKLWSRLIGQNSSFLY